MKHIKKFHESLKPILTPKKISYEDLPEIIEKHFVNYVPMYLIGLNLEMIWENVDNVLTNLEKQYYLIDNDDTNHDDTAYTFLSKYNNIVIKNGIFVKKINNRFKELDCFYYNHFQAIMFQLIQDEKFALQNSDDLYDVLETYSALKKLNIFSDEEEDPVIQKCTNVQIYHITERWKTSPSLTKTNDQTGVFE